MLHNQKIKLRYSDTSQAQYNTQQNKFTKILKKSIKDFTKWPAKKQMLAAGVVGAIFFTVLPILSATLPLALPGAVIALTLFFTVKAIFYAVKGIGWSGEKAVEGIKYSIGQIKDGAEYSKNKVKDGYKYSINSLEKGANFVGAKAKETASNALEKTATMLYNAAVKRDYSKEIEKFTPQQKEKSEEIKNQIKIILNDRQDNASLVKDILSGIISKIDLKIAEEKRIGWIDHTDRWKEQKKFINGLDAGKLKSLLTQGLLPKDSYFIDSIFSEHHSEIKKVIAEHKENHSLPDISQTLLGVKKMFEREESTESRKNKEQRSRLISSASENSSLNSVSTESSTAQLLNSREGKKVEPTTSVKEKMKSWFGRNEEQEVEVASKLKYQALSDSDLGANRSRSNSFTKVEATTRNNSLLQDVSMLLAQANIDVSGYSNSTNSFSSASGELMSNNGSLTRSTSSFSFHDSGPTKPPRTYQYSSNPFMEELTTTLKRRNSAPFSQMFVESVVHQQPREAQNKLS